LESNKHARESIDLQYFIMDDDIFGYSLLGLIYKKVLEGVRVRVLLDARGTKKLPEEIYPRYPSRNGSV
jgi:phosphatidylserine/phosphatidylglycerophosphate/cardiolipin synthase-like enzyme